MNRLPALGLLLPLLGAGAGCTPTVQVQAPEEPIVINMNVKIEHEVRVKVDEELGLLFIAGSIPAARKASAAFA